MIDLDQKMKVRIKKTFESVNVLHEGRWSLWIIS